MLLQIPERDPNERRKKLKRMTVRMAGEEEEPGGRSSGRRRGAPSAPCPPWGTGCCCCQEKTWSLLPNPKLKKAKKSEGAVVVSQRLTIPGKTSWYSWLLLTGLTAGCVRAGEPCLTAAELTRAPAWLLQILFLVEMG